MDNREFVYLANAQKVTKVGLRHVFVIGGLLHLNTKRFKVQQPYPYFEDRNDKKKTVKWTIW